MYIYIYNCSSSTRKVLKLNVYVMYTIYSTGLGTEIELFAIFRCKCYYLKSHVPS